MSIQQWVCRYAGIALGTLVAVGCGDAGEEKVSSAPAASTPAREAPAPASRPPMPVAGSRRRKPPPSSGRSRAPPWSSGRWSGRTRTRAAPCAGTGSATKPRVGDGAVCFRWTFPAASSKSASAEAWWKGSGRSFRLARAPRGAALRRQGLHRPRAGTGSASTGSGSTRSPGGSDMLRSRRWRSHPRSRRKRRPRGPPGFATCFRSFGFFAAAGSAPRGPRPRGRSAARRRAFGSKAPACY